MAPGKKVNQKGSTKKRKKSSRPSNTTSSSKSPGGEPGDADDRTTRSQKNRPSKNSFFQWNFLTIQNVKRILLPVPHQAALFVCCLVLVGSVLHELNLMPISIFSDSKNSFNQIFVKWGWGWTLSLLTPYMVLAGLLTCNKQWYLVLKDCLRLAVGTFFWFFWIQLFLAIEQATGTCNSDGFPTKKSCIRAGFHWDGFDISGHTFLLIHSLLTILEELQLVNEICKYRYSKNNENEWVDKVLPVIKPLMYTFTIILLLLCYMWVWMLFCTAVYFHTFSHKIIAAPIAVGTWQFTYRFWYQKRLSPGPVRSIHFERADVI